MQEPTLHWQFIDGHWKGGPHNHHQVVESYWSWRGLPRKWKLHKHQRSTVAVIHVSTSSLSLGLSGICAQATDPGCLSIMQYVFALSIKRAVYTDSEGTPAWGFDGWNQPTPISARTISSRSKSNIVKRELDPSTSLIMISESTPLMALNLQNEFRVPSFVALRIAPLVAQNSHSLLYHITRPMCMSERPNLERWSPTWLIC